MEKDDLKRGKKKNAEPESEDSSTEAPQSSQDSEATSETIESPAEKPSPKASKNWQRFINKRFAVIAAIVATIPPFLLTSAGTWTTGKIHSALNYVCAQVLSRPCEFPGYEEESDWEFIINPSIPNCTSGRIAFKLRDWSPAIEWKNGAEGLVVCADAEVTGKKTHLLEKIGARLSDCLTVERRDDQVAIATKLDSAAVCRAPYRYENREPQPTTLAQGIFVCLPGHVRQPSSETYVHGSFTVPKCDADVLREFGFLVE